MLLNVFNVRKLANIICILIFVSNTAQSTIYIRIIHHSCCRVQWHCWQQATVMMSWLITRDTWQQRDHGRDKRDGVMCPALSPRHSQINIVWHTWHVTRRCVHHCARVSTWLRRQLGARPSQWILSAAPPATLVLAQYSIRWYFFGFYRPLKCSICLVIFKFFSKTFSIKFWAIIMSIGAMPWWHRYLLPPAESPVSQCLPLPGCSELWRRCSFKFEMMFPWLARPLLGPCPGPASCCSGIKGKFSPVEEVDITTQLTNHSWCP